MPCCVKCFTPQHKHLITFIEKQGRHGGPCDYCGANDTILIEPRELTPLFEPLLTLYQPLIPGENVIPRDNWTEQGETFAFLLSDDFNVFSDEAVDRADDLIEAIFTDGLSPKEIDQMEYGFTDGTLWCDRRTSFGTTWSYSSAWDAFTARLSQEGRFVPLDKDNDMRDPQDWLPYMLSVLALRLPKGKRYFRGRRERHSLDHMGPPPSDKALAGRINPIGIPVLYLANGLSTACAEVRAMKHGVVSVAETVLTEPALVVDLTRARTMQSPFGYSEEDNLSLSWVRDRQEVLVHLNHLLGVPIDPKSPQPEHTPREYLASQYLARIIRNQGYDGIIYESSMGTGKNLALFPLDKAEAISVEYVRVERIVYHTKGILQLRSQMRYQ